MKKILVLFAAACCLFVACQKENSLKEVDDVCTKMDDSRFMKYCYENFDVNNDGKVSMQEAAAVKRIECYGEGITSLKGIEYFTTITYLRCHDNKLTSLDVSKNTQLSTLWCSSNHLTSLDVSKNILLVELWCKFNDLTSLDVSKNINLQSFSYNPQNNYLYITPTGWN